MLLALAAVSAVMFVLPAVASAEVAHVSSVGKFTLSGSDPTLTEHGESTKVTCETATGSGEFTTTTTGVITISFHGCKENVFNTSCTGEPTVGEETPGTITTTPNLEFHLIEIENNTPGVLITPKEGHFATFKCAGGLVTKKIGGNGIIGHITSTCGVTESTTHKIDFESTDPVNPGGTPAWSQITTAGTKYDLVNTSNNKTAVEDATGEIHFTDGVKRKIICT